VKSYFRPLKIKAIFCIQVEVGNVTSECDGVTRYRCSHVLRAITIKSDDVSYESRAINLRSDNDFNKPER
jgi:hypothetical protein